MCANTKPAVLLFGLALAATALGAAPVALAQTSPATPPSAAAPQTPPADAATAQIPLTPALVDQFIAAKKDVDAILEKLPDGTDAPDPATAAKLDTVVKTYKFDGYKQYDAAETAIDLVMAGVDAATKTYIGPDAVIKKQIAEAQADKAMSAKDKKEIVGQLNAALGTTPKLQYPGNVDVVVKAFDKLSAAMPQD